MCDQVLMSSAAPRKFARTVICTLVLLFSASSMAFAEGPTPMSQSASQSASQPTSQVESAANLDPASTTPMGTALAATDQNLEMDVLAGDAEGLLAENGDIEETVERTLPHNLSPLGMFMGADIVVQLVMLSLAFASLLTWTIWATKTLEIARAKSRLARADAKIAKVGSLTEALKEIGKGKSDVSDLLAAAFWEVRQSLSDTYDKEGVKERLISHLERLEAGSARRMSFGTGVLATIGSTSPFVGLFGTVWGIMNAFIGISEAQTTNLAVVAPGIAEALLATAIGLVAAIPAVMIYNHFSRQLGAYRAELSDVSAIIFRLVSRDLDRGRPDLFEIAE